MVRWDSPGGMRPRLLLLLFYALLALGTPDRASADDTSHYLTILRAAQADLRDNQPEVQRQVAARLRAIGPVTLTDGTSVTPRLASVVAMLEADPAEVEAARTHLNALVAELAAPDTVRSGEGETDPRAALQRVLERQEFQPSQPNPFTRYLLQALAWLGETLTPILKPILAWLAQLWRGAVGDRFPSIDWGQMASVAALLLVGGLAAWVARALRRAVGPGVATQASERGRAQTAEALRAQALLLSQGEDFLGAMRAMYLGALLRWDERGMLRFDRSLTNWELLARARVRADQPVARVLAPLVDRFERCWYGGAPCSGQEYGEFARLASAAWDIST